MPRINPVQLETTDANTSATLKAVKAKLGLLPNLFTTFAHAPAALTGYLQLSQALSSGRLSAQQREMIAIAIAQENACEYCLSAHAALGKGAGLDENDITQARNGKAVNVKNALITAFALKVAQSRGDVSDADFDAVRNAGLDDGLIIEIIANVALNVLTNYVNRVAGTEIDFPLVSLSTAA